MQTERTRSSRTASLVAAVPTGLAALFVIVLGLLVALGGNPVARYGDPSGWFGVGVGAAMLLLAAAGALLGNWAVPLFGAMFVLSLGALAAGAAWSADDYILVGVGGLLAVGCAAAVTYQLGRIAAAVARNERDDEDGSAT
jgi:hypothetical protein